MQSTHQLQLTRPLVFFDLEATGADRQKDNIIQFCFISYLPSGTIDVFTQLVKPLIPISESATKVHGITNDHVKDCFELAYYADHILQIIDDADLVGFGCLMFDVPLLFKELQACFITWDYTKCNIIDACNIFKRQVPRDLSSAHLHYCLTPFENAHDAKADVIATKDVFFAQLAKHEFAFDPAKLASYSNYDKPLVDLSGKFSVDDDGDIIFNFSQNKGQKAKDNISFLYWIVEREFPEDVKIICRRLLDAPTKEFLANGDLPF